MQKTAKYYAPGMMMLAAVIILYLFIQHFLSPYYISGPSMEPTYHEGNIVMTRPADDMNLTIGTVVIVKQRFRKIIKRVEGVPGDTVIIEGKPYTLKDDEYYVLGDNRDESYDSRRFGPVKRQDISAVVTRTLF